MAELENHKDFLSRQKPGTVGSQNLARGTQLAQALIIVQVPYTARKAIKSQQARRIRDVEKTRLYWSRIDIFVLMRLVWYMGTDAQKH